MKLVNEWWVPETMTGPDSYLGRSQVVHGLIKHATNFRSVVQAGGHIGTYPRVLSDYFQHVYTFEPDAANFACLVRNAWSKRLVAMRAFLGETHGTRELLAHKNTGGHQIGEIGGAIPTLRIDDMELTDCDAMFLDVEGYEWWALKGALATIKRCKPLLVLEENKQMRRRGRVAGDLEALVAPYGYCKIAAVGEDIVLSV